MPGYGYGETGRRRPRSSSRSSSQAPEKRQRGAKKAKAKKRKRRRGDEALEEEATRGGSAAAAPQQSSSRGSGGDKASADKAVVVDADRDGSRKPLESRNAQDPIARRGAWRDEIETTQGPESDNDVVTDVFVPMETDEEVERKLAESRARREALIAKWVNRGETQEGGGLFCPDTNTSMDAGDASESDGEVAQFFEERRKELESDDPKNQEALEDKKAVNRFILQCKAEHDGDMFQEDEDEQDALKRGVNQSAAISQTGASADDWNDKEGYYRAQISEVMDGRYRVVESMCGKGVFSNVVKAKDEQDKTLVAIKVMRCNDMMRKAAEKEVELLEKINRADKGNKKNVIRLIRTFNYRGHLCLVFECMWDNLRVALKKYTKDKGMSLRAIRAYTKQLLIGLRHIHRCGILHADVKPDNILITAGHNLVKICDLGSAMELTEIEPTPYLVSRFYRAPEICFGAKYGPQADTFAMGATLFELFTGKILFPGKSNNDMLRHFMELKGKFPHKMIKSGMNWKQHFDENLDFKYIDKHPVTRKKITRIITDCSAKRSMLDLIMHRVGPEKQKSDNKEDQLYVKKAKQFADLLTQMTALDPEKRATPDDLLQHPFVNEGMPASKATKETKAQPPA
mmetsp:Transcript_119647/g.333937  ORF Transcript_119647/g.333937 Transcript_119647/m.333937 type:complete len:629 (-) Transcript_119647:239-2125(-)